MNENLKAVANQILAQCDSTNLVAKKLAENGYPHGTWVSAKVQSSGRGRLGRKWESLEGNLFLSVVIRNLDRSLWSWVPLAGAVGVVRGLRTRFPELKSLEIKWPNDLCAGEAKVGGILCEGGGNSSSSYIVIGIGINCVSAPDGIGRETESLTALRNGSRTLAEDIRPLVLTAVLKEIEALKTQGSKVIAESYESWAVLKKDAEVHWGVNQNQKSGRVIGLGSFGELRVESSDGVPMSLYAEDVQRVLKSPTKDGGSLP